MLLQNFLSDKQKKLAHFEFLLFISRIIRRVQEELKIKRLINHNSTQ